MKKSIIALAAITAANNLQLALAASKMSTETMKPMGESYRTTPAFAMGGIDQHYLHQVADAHKITQALIARAQRDLDPIVLPLLKNYEWPGIPKGDSIKKALSHKPRFIGDQPPLHLLTDRKPRYTEEEHIIGGGCCDIIKRGPQQRPTQAGTIGRA